MAVLLIAMECTANSLYRPSEQYNLGLLRLRKTTPQQQQLEFNSVISNWDSMDTFFTPQLAQVSATYQNHTYTPCPWTYIVDHNFNRYPQYLYHARCDPSNNYKCYHGDKLSQCSCQQVNYTIPILTRTRCDDSTAEQHWTVDQAIVYGACVPRFN